MRADMLSNMAQHSHALTLRAVYSVYIMDWMDSYDEGMPVSIAEFEDNEYQEREYIDAMLISWEKDWLIELYHMDIEEVNE